MRRSKVPEEVLLRAVAAYDHERTIGSVADEFGLDPRTLEKAIARHIEHGTVNYDPAKLKHGRKPTVDDNYLQVQAQNFKNSHWIILTC